MKEENWFPVFHVPHDVSSFPEELMDTVCVPLSEFFRYHEKMRDAKVQEMVPEEYRKSGQSVIFLVSRLLCDVERFIGPEEVMERYGMGFCYEKAYDGTVIKNLTEKAKKIVMPYYLRHHALLDRICSEHSAVILFDLHSFSDEIVPKDFLRAGTGTPDVCIGADPVYTPLCLAALAEKTFQDAGFTTELNYPYSGCMIPNAVLSGNCVCSLVSVMIEINRRVFLDAEDRPDMDQLGKLRSLIRHIAADWLEQGSVKQHLTSTPERCDSIFLQGPEKSNTWLS